MISKENSAVVKFAIVLGVIILINLLNFIMNIYINVNASLGHTVIDQLFYIKFIAIVTLLVPLYRWITNKDVQLLKTSILVHTRYVFIISFFYFFILYLFKYDMVLNVMDILRNKMIEGNSALLLNFAVLSHNKLKYVQTTYQNFNSELILVIELLFILWNLRNMMALEVQKEEKLNFDPALYTQPLKHLALALIVMSFLSITLFEYTFLSSFDANFFMVSLFLFTVSIPLYVFIRKICRSQSLMATKYEFMTLHRLSLILSSILILGYIVVIIFNIQAMSAGAGSYRIVTSVISLVLSGVIFRYVLRAYNLTP